jgi:hypothetical protein
MAPTIPVGFNPSEKDKLLKAYSNYEKASIELDKRLHEIKDKELYLKWGYQNFRAMLENELGDTSMATEYVGDEPIDYPQVEREARSQNLTHVQVIEEMYKSGRISINKALQLAVTSGRQGARKKPST